MYLITGDDDFTVEALQTPTPPYLERRPTLLAKVSPKIWISMGMV